MRLLGRCVGTRRDGRSRLVGRVGSLPLLLLDEIHGSPVLLVDVLRRWSLVKGFRVALLDVRMLSTSSVEVQVVGSSIEDK